MRQRVMDNGSFVLSETGLVSPGDSISKSEGRPEKQIPELHIAYYNWRRLAITTGRGAEEPPHFALSHSLTS